MYTLETFNAQQLVIYRETVLSAFAAYEFTHSHVSQMTSARAAVAQSMALANAIAGYSHNNERINASALRGAIGRMEAIASVIKFGGCK